MTFGSPTWLFLLAALPVLALLFLRAEARGRKLLSRVVAARLRESLTASLSPLRRRVRFGLLLAGFAFCIVAMAKPQRGYVWDQVQRKGRDVLIAIDTSKSMNATDLAPDRLTRAKFAAQDLMEQLPGDRLGLIAFAGTAFLQAPLTIDYSAVLGSLNELDTNIIPEGGTNISAAIGAAREAFGKGESEHRALIIFTDGEDLAEDAVKTARQVAGSIRIFTVGVGTPDGSLVPVRDENGGTSFVKDPQGNFVKSRLDEAKLREIAEATGGFYLRLANGPADMRAIIGRGLAEMKERDIDARESRRPIERYQWPLALGLLLIAASVLVNERRRAPARRGTAMAAVAVMLAAVQPVHAASEGVELYNRQKYADSLAAFEKQLARRPDMPELQFDIGASAYKAGDYDKALQAFGKALTSPDADLRAKAQYNLGNTLYQRGLKQQEKEPRLREWNGALQHFDEVLKASPANADAKFNRDAVRKAIEELKKEEQKQQQQNQKDDKQQQKDQQKSQQDQQQPQQDKQNQQKQNEQARKDTEQALQKQNEANKEQDRQKKEQRQQEANDAAKQAQQSVDKAAESQKQQQQQDQQKQEKSAAEKAADEMKQAHDEQQKTEPQQGKPQEERDKAGQKAEEHLKNALDQIKEQQKQDQQQQQEGGKDGQKQEEKPGKQQDQGKEGEQKKDDNSAQQKQPEQRQDGGQSGQQGQPSPTPQPAGPENERKLSGEIKPQNEEKPDEKQQAAQAAAAEAAEKSGEMSERQAVMLLNSMKGDDANVSLREQKASVPVLRDW